MKQKLILVKANQLAVSLDKNAIYCDFCGTGSVDVFTSSFDDNEDNRKCETQICIECIKQLFKLIPKGY